MKRSELRRGRSRMARKPVKRSQPNRDWGVARAKVESEGSCRLWKSRLGCDGGGQSGLEAAHVVGRENDRYVGLFSIEMETLDSSTRPETRRSPWPVEPERIVPLCRTHHRAYDAHELDLLPYLTVEEQVQAVVDADGIEQARIRTAPLAYREVP